MVVANGIMCFCCCLCCRWLYKCDKRQSFFFFLSRFLLLCGFVILLQGVCVQSCLALCFHVVFSVLFSILVTSFGEDMAGLCAVRVFVCLLCNC